MSTWCGIVWMLGQIEIFLGHHDALFEQVLVDCFAILCWNEHIYMELD